MSDPVSHAEVEDVLSSIRRLVSDDGRPKTGPGGDGRAAQKAADRLVLTPALRVLDDDVAEDDVAEDDVTEDDLDHDTDPMSDDATGADAHRAADDTDGAAHVDDAPEQGETATAAPQDSDPVSFDRSQSRAYFFLDHLRKDARTPGRTPQSAPDAPAHGSGQDTATPEGQADDAPLILSEDIAVTPDHDEDRAHHAATAQEPQGATDAAPDPQAENDAPENGGHDAPPVMFRRTSTRDLTSKIAALEEVIAKTPDQWEPDDTGKDDYSGTEVEAMEWDDDIEADAPDAPEAEMPEPIEATAQQADRAEHFDHAEAAPEPEQDQSEQGRGGDDTFVAQPAFRHRADPYEDDKDDDQDAILDEDALRDLVSDIVRQELQGGLGERITRNVRKLVRREIQRALAELDMD